MDIICAIIVIGISLLFLLIIIQAIWVVSPSAFLIIIPVIIAVVLIIRVLCIKISEKKYKRKQKEEKLKQEKEDTTLNLLKAVENELRFKYTTTAYDVTVIVYEQAMQCLEACIHSVETDVKNAHSSQEIVSAIVCLHTEPGRYSFDNYHWTSFEKDLRKSNLKNQKEANAFSYAVLQLAFDSINKITPNISMTAKFDQEELTLDNSDEIRTARITITATNPNYKSVTDWRNLPPSPSKKISVSSAPDAKPTSLTKPTNPVAPKSINAFLNQTQLPTNREITLGINKCDIKGGFADRHIKIKKLDAKWVIYNISLECRKNDKVTTKVNGNEILSADTPYELHSGDTITLVGVFNEVNYKFTIK